MNIPHDIPNHQLTEYLYSKASRAKIPLSGCFELSPVCNFACRMCYIRKTPKEVQEHDRPILQLEDWLRIAREGREQGLLYLLLTGGEPFLWPDFWKLYDALIDMGMLVAINTNGSLIDDAAVEHLKAKPPRRINITLYGASDATYKRLCGATQVFSRVDRAIRVLKEAGISVKLNCSLTPANACDQEKIIEYAHRNQLNLAMTTYMFPPVRRDPNMVGVNERFTPEEAAEYRMRSFLLQYGGEAYQKYLVDICSGSVDPPGLEEGCVDPVDGRIRCRAGKSTFWITWDGWLTACGMMPEPKVDLKDLDFPSAWQRITELAAQTCLSGVCDKCSNSKICYPCAAMAAAETGSAAGIPRYLCQMTQRMRQIAESDRDGNSCRKAIDIDSPRSL